MCIRDSNYAFETLGTDVKITFEMLDTDKVGAVSYTHLDVYKRQS